MTPTRRWFVIAVALVATIVGARRWWNGPREPRATRWTQVEIATIDLGGGGGSEITAVDYTVLYDDTELCHLHRLAFPGIVHPRAYSRHIDGRKRADGRRFVSLPIAFEDNGCHPRLQSALFRAMRIQGNVEGCTVLTPHPREPIRVACARGGASRRIPTGQLEAIDPVSHASVATVSPRANIVVLVTAAPSP